MKETRQPVVEKLDEKANPRARMAVLLLLIAIMCGFIFLYYRQNRATTTQKNSDSNPYNQNMSNPQGKMRIVFDDTQSVFTVGEQIAFSVYADTHGQKVVGFDVVLPISSQQAKMLTVKSLQTGITAHGIQTADKISISGVMSFEDVSDQSRAFANEPIMHVVLKPFVTTSLPISISFAPGDTSDSNLVLADARDILGSVEGAVAYVGSEHMLTLQQTQKITDTISMTLQPAITPSPTCADCLTSVPVLVSSKGVSTIHTFEFGGIAGMQHASQEIEGGIAEATFESPTTLRIRYAQL